MDTLDVSMSSSEWDLRDGDDVGGNILIGGGGADNLVSGLGADNAEGQCRQRQLRRLRWQRHTGGGEGDDWLVGGAGNDQILGGSGADTIEDAAEKDVVRAGAGNDTIYMGGGYSSMVGWTTTRC